jgi:hypothetical protein
MNQCSKRHDVVVDRHSKKLGVCASQHQVLKLLMNFKVGILPIKILHHGFYANFKRNSMSGSVFFIQVEKAEQNIQCDFQA